MVSTSRQKLVTKSQYHRLCVYHLQQLCLELRTEVAMLQATFDLVKERFINSDTFVHGSWTPVFGFRSLLIHPEKTIRNKIFDHSNSPSSLPVKIGP